MKFKNGSKRFLTLNPNNSEGFTLVELIVVIAILAILAGVAVPAYNGYIEKANKQADISLVSEVAHALELHYYSNPTNATSDYVVLSSSGATAGGNFATTAMDAAFGDGWAQTAVLKYDGWSDNGLLDLVADYTPEELDLIANSSFLTNSNSKGLMNAVTNLTGLVGNVIREKSADPEKARRNLTTIFGADSEILDKLDALEEDGLKDSDYPTAISNLLVNFMADTIETKPTLQSMINMYASAFAYAEKTGDRTALDQMDRNLANVSMGILSFEAPEGSYETAAEKAEIEYGMGFATMLEGMTTEQDGTDVPVSGFEGFLTYVDEGAAQIESDNSALSVMMGAVKQISNSFLDVEHVTNSELFATGEVAEQVDNYLNSVEALASMDKTSREALDNFETGAIVVFISKEGVTSVVPGAAWLAS